MFIVWTISVVRRLYERLAARYRLRRDIRRTDHQMLALPRHLRDDLGWPQHDHADFLIGGTHQSE